MRRKRTVDVDCYSGRKADERPVRFRLDGREYIVVEVLAQWYGPGGAFYDVRTDEGDWYRLEHQNSMPDAAWQLVEYRRGLH